MSRVDGKWWDVSWNPVTGCTPISEGCANCWAKGMANRLRGRAEYPEDEPFRVTLHRDKMNQLDHWKKPRDIFVSDMGDLFHKEVPWKWIRLIWRRMWIYTEHTFLVLTKRPARMLEFFTSKQDYFSSGEPIGFAPDNIWLGVTCENQKWADIRIPELLKIPAAVRFLSVEPLLGPIDLKQKRQCIKCDQWIEGPLADCSPCAHGGIDWVIIGCESGPKRRPCRLEWVKSIVEQCQAASVPVWVKQLNINGKVSHRMEEWPEWARLRERPE